MTTFEAAEAYLELGFSLFPLQPRKKQPAVGKWSAWRDKKPTLQHLKSWFEDRPEAGIAIVCGSISRLAVRDFDEPEAYLAWKEANQGLAKELPTVKTHNGYHVYVGVSEKVQSQVCDDGEFRAEGVYVVAPPSLHEEGTQYEWLNGIPDSIRRLSIEQLNQSGLACAPIACLSKYLEYPEYPVSLCHIGLGDRVIQAIETTLPEGPGRRVKALFKLARKLKAIPEVACAEIDQLQQVLQRWHEKALDRGIRTREFAETFMDFAYAWVRVKFPDGDSHINQIYGKALISKPPACASDPARFSNSMRLLAAFCRELQRFHGSKPFFLDLRTAGQYIGVSYQTISRWIGGFEVYGILERVSTGSQASGKASEFRYLPPLDE